MRNDASLSSLDFKRNPSGKSDLTLRDLESLTKNVLIKSEHLKIIKQVGEGISLLFFNVCVGGGLKEWKINFWVK